MYSVLYVLARSIRMIGSAALHLCSVAEGRSDAYFEMGLHCWDMAAGALIVLEAGGFLLHPDGARYTLSVYE